MDNVRRLIEFYGERFTDAFNSRHPVPEDLREDDNDSRSILNNDGLVDALEKNLTPILQRRLDYIAYNHLNCLKEQKKICQKTGRPPSFYFDWPTPKDFIEIVEYAIWRSWSDQPTVTMMKAAGG